jgi:hypothetical protein
LRHSASRLYYGKATAYLPVIELLRGYFEIDSRDDPRRIGADKRSLHLGRTGQFVDLIPHVAAGLSVAYARAGRTEEALELVGGAVNEFRAGRGL